MDFFDRRREALVRAVRERDWIVSIDSSHGEVMRDLQCWVGLNWKPLGPITTTQSPIAD